MIGVAVALNAAGDRLAVGASGDGGATLGNPALNPAPNSGAVRSAVWLARQQSGWYDMTDVLGLH